MGADGGSCQGIGGAEDDLMTACSWKVYREPQCLYAVSRPVERVAQPSSGLEGGSFNCAALAILQQFLPEAPTLDVLWEDVWEGLVLGPQSKGPSGLKDHADFWSAVNDWGDVRLQAVVDPPLSLPDTWGDRAHGPTMFQEDTFSKRCRAYLEAGYVGYCAVQFERRSDVIRYKNQDPAEGSDHVVVLDGFREMYRSTGKCSGDGPQYSGHHYNEIHVVCSTVREDYWVDSQEFIREHGGYQVIWVRQDPRKEPRHLPKVQAPRCGNGHPKKG